MHGKKQPKQDSKKGKPRSYGRRGHLYYAACFARSIARKKARLQKRLAYFARRREKRDLMKQVALAIA